MLCVISIAIVHIIAAGVDQGFRHIFFGEGSTQQVPKQTQKTNSILCCIFSVNLNNFFFHFLTANTRYWLHGSRSTATIHSSVATVENPKRRFIHKAITSRQETNPRYTYNAILWDYFVIYLALFIIENRSLCILLWETLNQ